jgi:hypothetical protein
MNLIDAVKSGLRDRKSSSESTVILVVTGRPDALKENIDVSLGLYGHDEAPMQVDDPNENDIGFEAGEYRQCYRLKPGRYYMAFRAPTGERLAQSVPALPGRQTLVFLRLARADVFVADGNDFFKSRTIGVEPSKTTIVTVTGEEDDYRVRERVRLARLMTYMLGDGAASLSRDVVDVLDDPKTDPILKLYGSLVALSVYERWEMLPEGSREREALLPTNKSWATSFRDWIGDPSEPGLPSDALAACWRLRNLNPTKFENAGWGALPSRIEAPPMLECAWRWAIEESITRPAAVRSTAIIAAAARSAGGSRPWLCWHLAAAKAKFTPTPASAGDLKSLVKSVAEAARRLVDPDGGHLGILEKLSQFGPDVQATALRTLDITSRRSNNPDNDVTDLAVALGLPSQLLQKWLVKTKNMLDLVPCQSEELTTRSASHEGGAAPGISRRIVHSDDLQKGRFGGRHESGGFVVSADFERTSSKNWVRVILRVTGPGRDSEEVQFHLHNSFKPPLQVGKFRSGSAKLTVTVWGGFTLGVWIPRPGVELELDLAELDEAPRIVKER